MIRRALSFLLLCGSCFGAIAHTGTDSKNNNTGATSSVTVTLGTGQGTSGNFLQIAVAETPNGGSLSTVKDNNNNSATQCGTGKPTGSGSTARLFYLSLPATATSIVVTASGSDFLSVAVGAWSGVATSSQLDGSCVTAASTTTTVTTAALGTSGDVIGCAVSYDGSGTTITPNTGFTSFGQIVGSGTIQAGAGIYDIIAAATAGSAKVNTAGALGIICGAFLPASAGATPAPRQHKGWQGN